MRNLYVAGFVVAGLLIGFISLSVNASNDVRGRDPDGNVVINKNYEEKGPWQEAEATIPTFPQDEALIKIYVSAVTTHTYMIDSTTLQPGSDGVVRYVLVVRTAGGAQNISFEGIHCKEHKWKLYATGQRDGTWSKARVSEWRPIENKSVNRYHAALSREYFCPQGAAILSVEEGRDALRRGHHPSVIR